MQEACDEGLRPAPAERRRCVVVPIHQATEALAVELVRMWAGRSVDEAIETLASPDVTVTNQSDKELQLYSCESSTRWCGRPSLAPFGPQSRLVRFARQTVRVEILENRSCAGDFDSFVWYICRASLPGVV